MTFSGGVAEYLYKRETQTFGDLGFDLAEALRHLLAHRRDLPPVWDPGQGIRATVIGAAQFSVQISGNTILIADRDKLPLQNLPVISCNFPLGEEVAADAVTAEVRARWRNRTSTKARARSRSPSPGTAIPRMRGFMPSPPASARRCRAPSPRRCRSSC